MSNIRLPDQRHDDGDESRPMPAIVIARKILELLPESNDQALSLSELKDRVQEQYTRDIGSIGNILADLKARGEIEMLVNMKWVKKKK